MELIAPTFSLETRVVNRFAEVTCYIRRPFFKLSSLRPPFVLCFFYTSRPFAFFCTLPPPSPPPLGRLNPVWDCGGEAFIERGNDSLGESTVGINRV